MDNPNTELYECSKCHVFKPRTNEYFAKYNRNKKDGLKSSCKECENKATSENYQKNIERERKRSAKKYRDNLEYYAQYYQDNAEEIKERTRTNRIENSDHYTEYEKQRRATPERKIYMKVAVQGYFARKLSLPDTLTVEQWEYCLQYFEGRCAYCGSTEKIQADHFIALMDNRCTGTVVENMIPACQRCNCSKNDSDPLLWLQRRFHDNWNEIHYRILLYFSVVQPEPFWMGSSLL